jgi:hypothetical protein
VVVHGVVQVALTEAGFAVAVTACAGAGGPVALGLGASHAAPATSIGDVAQFLDVDMYQVAGRGVFIAADYPPAGAVKMAQRGQSVANQDSMHR